MLFTAEPSRVQWRIPPRLTLQKPLKGKTDNKTFARLNNDANALPSLHCSDVETRLQKVN